MAQKFVSIIKYGAFVAVLWKGMLLSYFAQEEIQSRRVTGLILHKEKYNAEDLQC